LWWRRLNDWYGLGFMRWLSERQIPRGGGFGQAWHFRDRFGALAGLSSRLQCIRRGVPSREHFFGFFLRRLQRLNHAA
jgi:hypothetical protein